MAGAPLDEEEELNESNAPKEKKNLTEPENNRLYSRDEKRFLTLNIWRNFWNLSPCVADLPPILLYQEY